MTTPNIKEILMADIATPTVSVGGYRASSTRSLTAKRLHFALSYPSPNELQ